MRPRAGRDEIVGWQDARLRVRVAAPPADGAANEAVRALLAERLSLARSRVEIVRGQTARTKIVRVLGLSPEDLFGRLGMPGAVAPARAVPHSA